MRGDAERIEKVLAVVVVLLEKQGEQLETTNRIIAGLQTSVRLNTSASTQTLTYVKRIQPYIEKAMSALHKAFHMVVNGILNLREEKSEFAGSIIDTEYDKTHIKIV